MKKPLLVLLVIITSFAIACKQEAGKPDNSTTSKTNKAEDKKPETKLSEDGFVTSEEGTEKEKPESGKANVAGKALYNEKPAANVEVKLCETFNSFSGCGGKQFTTKTDENGEYLIKNVEPKEYSALTVRVFNTPSYIFASRSFGIASAKYKIEADKTFFAPVTNLFKSDSESTKSESYGKSRIKCFRG